MKIYIHKAHCISPQQTFEEVNLEDINHSENNRLKAIEPAYEGIPRGLLRRMGKAVRLGVGAASPIIGSHAEIDGVIIGTANGGMENCVHFFNQIVEYDEGNLTPTHFVQSTPNAIAGQIGMMTANRGYNNTHVHQGHSFENAVIDAHLQLINHPENSYLLGGVDEISSYNYNIDFLDGWNKKEVVSNVELYESQTKGSIAGEGAAMFLVSGKEEGAVAKISATKTWQSSDHEEAEDIFKDFVTNHLPNGNTPSLILSGDNGDSRANTFFRVPKNHFPQTAVARFKHLVGESPTASAISVWLAQHFLETQQVPDSMLVSQHPEKMDSVLIYNNYHLNQHSLMLVKKVN